MRRGRPAHPLREAGIERAQEIGQAAAARELGVPAGTVASWCSRAGVRTPRSTYPRDRAPARRVAS